jgi:hypothetical protein
MGKNNDFLNYGKYISAMSFDPMGFMSGLFAQVEENKRRQRNADAGIEYQNGYFGVPSKNIAFELDSLNFKGDCYAGHKDDLKFLFDIDGKLLFSAPKYEYLGKNIFLVYKTEKTKKKSEEVETISEYGALYKLSEKLTGYEFRTRFSSSDFKKDENFIILSDKESKSCIVNLNGEVVLRSKERYGYCTSIYNNVARVDNGYYSLLTKEFICEKGYDNMIETKELIFISVGHKEQVYKINKFTGEYEVFGEPKQAPQINNTPICNGSDVTVAEVLPTLLKQGRNDKCRCGSNKKYKACCGKGKC